MVFLSTLVSYIIVVIAFFAVISLGVFIGISLRKKSNNKIKTEENK